MSSIIFEYENNKFQFDYDPESFEVIGNGMGMPLSDIQIGKQLDSPIGTYPLEEIIKIGDRVLFIVPDSSRMSGAGAVINLVVRRLIANGTMPYDMAILFANEKRPQVTESEKESILTPFIAQRLVSFSHNHRDITGLAVIGNNGEGSKVILNRTLIEYDHVVSIADVDFDLFAGYTGGPELLCPGAAATESIKQINLIRSHTNYKNLKEAARSAINSNNPVLTAIGKFTESIPHSFSIHTTVNENGELTKLACGDGHASFKYACEEHLSTHLFKLEEKKDIVIVGGGRTAHQIANAIFSAADVCISGGAIYLITDSFDPFIGNKIYSRLLTEITKTFQLKIVSQSEYHKTAEYSLEQIFPNDLINETAKQKGYIIPFGGKYLFDIRSN